MKQKLLTLCPIADKEVEQIIAKFYDIDVMSEPTEEKVFGAIAPYDAVIVPYTAPMLISERVIDAAPNLKLIASTYGGTRQNIADIYAIERGITVIHTGASRERPMAEYTLGLVLSSFLRIHNYHHDMVSGEAWPRFKYPRTRIVNNRSVAVVGYGRIGKAIVNLFKCFTDKISVVSRHLSAEDAAKDGVKVVSLNDAFANNEVIILAGGHNSETDKLTLLLFTSYIDAATSMSESCGGGGTSPSSGWGKDEDDDWEWAKRCAQMAHSMVTTPKPQIRRRRGR